jgi:hypothetical protein
MIERSVTKYVQCAPAQISNVEWFGSNPRILGSAVIEQRCKERMNRIPLVKVTCVTGA